MNTKSIAINGFGRIGRLFFRQIFENPALRIAAVNDLGNVENLAYLLKYDSVYRTWNHSVSADPVRMKLIIDGREISVVQEKDPTKLPWRQFNIDIVIESTGLFESFQAAAVHQTAGAKRVVISAPAKDLDGETGKTVLMGVNEDNLKTCSVSSNGSCTTNAASPVMQILSENPGIQKAFLSTTHAYTATQNLVDAPVRGGRDFRRGRAGAQNISPSSTGAAISVARVIPKLSGKFDGIALRSPVLAGSVADITFLASRKTTVEEINSILTEAASSAQWKDILKVTNDQIVSSDVIGEPYGAIVDLSFTKVVDGDLVKVLSWYDNEWGYVSTLVKHVLKVAELL